MPQNNSLTGQVIDGRYRLDRLIGAGGMGVVYRAFRLSIGDEVAVKILRLHQESDTATERFRREAQITARLKHPNAVTIYDYGVTPDHLIYFVMELVEGQTLKQLIRQGAVSPAMTAVIAAQICAALDEAHGLSIVHRDIKPDNVIVQSTSSGLKVKVLDFGIAKVPVASGDTLTQVGETIGTPQYMSPEQCLGEELDHRTDIYSLGVVVYEMLCGTPPFDAQVSMAVVVQQVTQPPPALRVRDPRLSPAVEAVVMSALEKARERRPQTAGAFASALIAAVNQAPSHASAAPTAVLPPASFAPQVSGAHQYAPPPNVAPAFTPHQPYAPPPVSTASSSYMKLLVGLLFVLVLAIGVLAWRLGSRTNNDDQQQSGTETARPLAGETRPPPEGTPPSTQQRVDPAGSAENPSAGSASEPVGNAPFSRSYSGAIDGRYKIVMRLNRDGSSLTGSYFYTSARNAIEIQGSIDASNRFVINGYYQGSLIDEFSGVLTDNSVLQGRFVRQKDGKTMSFYLRASN